MTWSTLVEFELQRAVIMTRKDKIQRWVTMDGVIHSVPVPYRDAISVTYYHPIGGVVYNYRPRVLAHSAIGCI